MRCGAAIAVKLLCMNAPSWQHTKPLPQPTRHRMRGRTDFEDSLLSARREEQAKEKRRFQAMTEALKARGIPSDPDGSRFRAAREQAIATRRAENARLQTMFKQPFANRPDFAETEVGEWDVKQSPSSEVPARPLRQWIGMVVIAAGLGLGLVASMAWPG